MVNSKNNWTLSPTGADSSASSTSADISECSPIDRPINRDQGDRLERHRDLACLINSKIHYSSLVQKFIRSLQY